MFGRRPDGRRVKGIDPVIRITGYVMPMRCDAQVFLKHKADLEALSAYTRQAKERTGRKITHMQVLIAAYVRAVSENPQINRFIMNKQLFARNNCSVAFTILRDPQDIDAGEAVVKIKFDLSDTIFDVGERMNAAIARNRRTEEKTFVDKLLGGLFAVPGLATFVVWLVRGLDRFGIAPKALIEELPFYVGMYVTNLASIGLHDVNHHLYNWGDVSLFFSIGIPEKAAEAVNGQTVMKRYMPIGITADERICSGAHYARFFNSLRRYVSHPELLEQPPKEVRFDEGLEYHEPKPV